MIVFEYITFILFVILVGLTTWFFSSKFYEKQLLSLKTENLELKAKIGLNENIINTVKAEFSKIAQESLKNQQEQLLSVHSTDLKTKMDLFKAEEISPLNTILKDFKDSIDNYQKSHKEESLEIKNAISIAEKYAKALTTNQNSKGEFGEKLLEQTLNFANLKENVHYTKQFSQGATKPDFIIYLPENKHLIIDSKVILKNYLEYRETETECDKKAFLNDLTTCINQLGNKHYEQIENTHQAGFILMYIPIESCVNLIYTDPDFRKILELANAHNIIITGTSSIIVTLRLVANLWTTKNSYDNVKNIIETGEKLYNNIATHAQNLLTIQSAIENASKSINSEINRFKEKNNGSIFKEAEKLHEFGIEAKNTKSGKKFIENKIPEEFLTTEE
ncbi:dNA recombination protein RmuC [Clostridium sp. CAG:813]|nr:dNA recombination protein RmuC [Clostridium sp. CAG:813]